MLKTAFLFLLLIFSPIIPYAITPTPTVTPNSTSSYIELQSGFNGYQGGHSFDISDYQSGYRMTAGYGIVDLLGWSDINPLYITPIFTFDLDFEIPGNTNIQIELTLNIAAVTEPGDVRFALLHETNLTDPDKSNLGIEPPPVNQNIPTWLYSNYGITRWNDPGAGTLIPGNSADKTVVDNKTILSNTQQITFSGSVLIQQNTRQLAFALMTDRNGARVSFFTEHTYEVGKQPLLRMTLNESMVTPIPQTPTFTPVIYDGYYWLKNPDNGNYYTYIQRPFSWEEAKDFAETLGGHLITITSAAEDQWIYETFGHVGWIGLRTDTGWVTGEALNYTRWAPREPSGDGVYVTQGEFIAGWNDRPDMKFASAIIEIEEENFILSPTITPTITPFPVSPQPVAWWKMDEKFGLTSFDSIGLVHGTNIGASINQQGKMGQAYEFNGINSRIIFDNNNALPNSSTLSISFWINMNNTHLDQTIAVNFSQNWMIYTGQFDSISNGITFAIRTGSSEIHYVTTPRPTTGEWTHYTVTWDGSDSHIYLNGLETINGLENGRYIPDGSFPNEGSGFMIGSRGDGFGFLGLLDDFKIYDTILTPEQVQNIYLSDLTPPNTPTPAPTPLEIHFQEGGLIQNNMASSSPSGYLNGRVSFGNVLGADSNDGVGMKIDLNPGQGMLLFSLDPIVSPGLMQISSRIKTSNAEPAVALIALNSSLDGQFSFVNLSSNGLPVGQYKDAKLYYNPPDGQMLLGIQAVNSPFSSVSTTVLVDDIAAQLYMPSNLSRIDTQVDGTFERGFINLIENFNNVTGKVIPIFNSFTDIAMQLMVLPGDTAANTGTIVLDSSNHFPSDLIGSVKVKRDLSTSEGSFAMVITNGYQNYTLFRNVSAIPAMEAEVLLGGAGFYEHNPNIPITLVVQNGGSNTNSTVVIDDLFLSKP